MEVFDLGKYIPQEFDITSEVEDWANKEGLNITLKTSLKQYANSSHFHLKNGTEAGVLELTFDGNDTAWFHVQSGRKANWIEERIEDLSTTLKSRLK